MDHQDQPQADASVQGGAQWQHQHGEAQNKATLGGGGSIVFFKTHLYTACIQFGNFLNFFLQYLFRGNSSYNPKLG